jgi:hypothetical protein
MNDIARAAVSAASFGVPPTFFLCMLTFQASPFTCESPQNHTNSTTRQKNHTAQIETS